MLDIALVVCLEGLLELHLLRVPLGVEDLGLQTKGLLSNGRGLVRFTSLALSPADRLTGPTCAKAGMLLTCARSNLTGDHVA